VGRILAGLPETLDETYERILQEIPKSNQVYAHRLLQCLTVAVRPLRVDELAEVLAVDFTTSEGIPKLNESLRWEDQEQAVLSACSSLIAVVDDEDDDSRVVQFSHFSVKEFLTSDRLATSKIDASRYHHILLEPAHTIMAQACLGVLLRFDSHTDKTTIKNFPLARYAADHFGKHADFEDVLSHIRDGVDVLLDADKSHFAAWLWILPGRFGEHPQQPKVTPLHHVAGRGFRSLVDYLISRRPEDVNLNGEHGTPLHAALYGMHGNVAQLLLGHCVDVDVRDSDERTPLHLAAYHGLLGITRALIERNADINARDKHGRTPLYRIMANTYPTSEKIFLDVAEFLLEHGADADAKGNDDSTALHAASFHGGVKAVQFMLEHGANIHVRDKQGQTPLHRAMDDFIHGYSPTDIDAYLDGARCLLSHGADVDALDDDHATPLHVASRWDCAKAVQILLEHGASVHLKDNEGRTPFQVAEERGKEKIMQLLSEHLQSEQKM
jgi:ankyrin repeat protein